MTTSYLPPYVVRTQVDLQQDPTVIPQALGRTVERLASNLVVKFAADPQTLHVATSPVLDKPGTIEVAVSGKARK